MSRRMPPRYCVLTGLRGVRRLAFLIVAPPTALATYWIMHLTGHSWPADSVLECLSVLVGVTGPTGFMVIIALSWLEPRLAVLQVTRKLSHSGFTSVTRVSGLRVSGLRVSGLTDYPIGKAVFTAIDTVDDDQPVTIEASWCYRHLLITVRERKEDR